MRLILVRHPAPHIAAGLCYGSSDVPIDQDALRAALSALASTLAWASDTRLPIWSSPLQRCTALSIPLAAQLKLPPPTLDARLAEMDFGAWELRPWDSIARAEIDAWTRDLVHYAPGGAETVLQVAERVAGFLADAIATNPGSAIVVCHAGTIRLLIALHEALAQGAQLDGATLARAALQAAGAAHRIDYAASWSLQF